MSFESNYSVTGATGGYIDIAPLASLPPLPRGYLFAGADDQPVNSSAGAGMSVAAAPGLPPVVIEPDSFVESVNGTDTAAIRVPSGTVPARNLTVATGLAAVTFAPSTNITVSGTTSPYTGTINVTEASKERARAAVAALGTAGIANASDRIGVVVEIGSASADISLDVPARVLLLNQSSPARAFHMNSTGGVTEISACGGSPAAEWLASNATTAPFCYTVPGGDAATKDYTST